MKNAMDKRLSRYLDELGDEDINKIQEFSLPWQKNFLIRFYEQLKIKQYKKVDVSYNVNSNTDKYKLLPDNYTLPENTLTQFTNYNSSNMRVVSVSNLIAVSNAFDVSINYLLGIDSCETPENTDIYKKTGLKNETIETIKNDKGLQEKLNFFLLSPKMTAILKEIDNEFFMQRIIHDILNAYNKPLLAMLESAYNKFNLETFPLDRTLEKYTNYLYKEIPFENLEHNKIESITILTYLRTNLSSDYFNQIQMQLEQNNITSDQDVYSFFINQTAEFTFDLLEHKHNGELIKNKLAQSFLELLNDYWSSRIKPNNAQ